MENFFVTEEIFKSHILSIKKSTSEEDVLKKTQYLMEWLLWLQNKKILSLEQKKEFEKEIHKVTKEVFKKRNQNQNSKIFYIKTFLYILLCIVVCLVIYFLYVRSSLPKKTYTISKNVLPYKGTLLTSNGLPVTAKTDVVFRLYAAKDSRVPFFTGKCVGSKGVIPDYKGDFSITIGKDCGMESIVSDNLKNGSDVYLGVQIAHEPELVPRQKVSSNGYSSDAAMLQGLELGSMINSIPYINSEGAVLLNNSNNTIKSTNGSLTIESQSLILKSTKENSSIVLQPGINSNTIIATGKLGIGSFSPTELLSIEGNEPYGSVASLGNFANNDDISMNVLDLKIGSPAQGDNTSFIKFYANSNKDSKGELVGAIKLNNEGVVYETSGADFAEYFTIDEPVKIQPGLIITISKYGIRLSRQGESVIGVVSSNAGFIGNKKDDTKKQVLVGLQGQIKTSVVDTNGKISQGDKVSLSKINGLGEKNNNFADVVGIALESMDESKTDCPDNVLIDEHITCKQIFVLIK